MANNVEYECLLYACARHSSTKVVQHPTVVRASVQATSNLINHLETWHPDVAKRVKELGDGDPDKLVKGNATLCLLL